MGDEARELKYRTAADFVRDAEDSDVVNDLFQQLEDEESETVLNGVQRRRQEDWSVLAMQVVGSEYLDSR